MNQSVIKIIAGLGSFITLATAYLHYGGLGPARESVAGAESDFMRHALITMWALYSIHLILIAALAFGASFYKSKACAAFLMAFGAWLMMDGLIIWTHVAWFPGVPVLMAAGLCYLIAGFMLRKSVTS